MIQTQNHEFAFYVPNLNAHPIQSQINLENPSLIHRMIQVLRFQVGEHCILFSNITVMRVFLNRIIKKNSIVCTVVQLLPLPHWRPNITFLLPLLKKNNLEQAVTQLSELGVNGIQLIITEKVSRKTITIHELERLTSISIAACELSKQFIIPTIVPPRPLVEALTRPDTTSFAWYADLHGAHMKTQLINIYTSTHAHGYLSVGPEGGFTPAEITLFEQYHFQSCALTQTVLPAAHAAALLAGIIRSCTE